MRSPSVSYDNEEPRFGLVQRRLGHVVPAQPGVPHNLLGLGHGAQHALGDAKQPRAKAFESTSDVVHRVAKTFGRSIL